MNKNDKQFKEIADKLKMTPKELETRIANRIEINRMVKKRQEEVRKATSKPYPKRDPNQVKIRPVK